MNLHVPQGDITPLFFGTSRKPLFGCYHAPVSQPWRSYGVVLCPALGHEYIVSHRAYRQLAIRLARVGFHVLRFDFYGCGDSAGADEEGDIQQWRCDITRAIDEIRSRCGVSQLCLVGLRLGGALAMLVGAERGDISHMVFWDPVVHGRRYIKELMTLHRQRLSTFPAPLKRSRAGETYTEILGFPFPDTLQSALAQLDLLHVQQRPAEHTFVIDTNATREAGCVLSTHLETLGTQVEYRHLPNPGFWIEDINNVLVPHQVLQAIVSWMSEGCV